MPTSQKKSNELAINPAIESLKTELSTLSEKDLKDHVLSELDLLFYDLKVCSENEMPIRIYATMQRRVTFITKLIEGFTPSVSA